MLSQIKIFNFYFKALFIKKILTTILCMLPALHHAQFSITIKYKKAKCGGARNQDTTSYFLLANKKWILQHPHQKIDTLYTDINGRIKIPNKKGTYYLYEPWKYYHQAPPYFPPSLYNKTCLQNAYTTPDFTITVSSKKKYKISPLYYYLHCPDKHPCLRTDTIIPRIPTHH